jgi:hypothetical protein
MTSHDYDGRLKSYQVMRISRKKETTNDDHRWMPLRSGALQHSFQAVVRASLLVSDCQHIGAGSGTVNVLFPSETVEAEGELADYQSQADSGTLMHRQFCPSCGTPVFTQANTRPQYIGVRAGTLDDPDLGNPQITIWTSSAPSWACFDPALPREEKQAPPSE